MMRKELIEFLMSVADRSYQWLDSQIDENLIALKEDFLNQKYV